MAGCGQEAERALISIENGRVPTAKDHMLLGDHLDVRHYGRFLRATPAARTPSDIPLDVFEECLGAVKEYNSRGVWCSFDPHDILIRSPDHLKVFIDGQYVNGLYCGRTMLYAATISRNREMAIQLINAGADPNIPDHGDDAVLRTWVQRLDIEMVGLLLRHGANPDIADRGGLTVRNCVRELFALLEMQE
jgi:hypothetical protein